MNIPQVKLVKLSRLARLPEYSTTHAAGMDLCAAVEKQVSLKPREIKLVPTGLALKHGISIVNAPGTIDSDYRGEVGVILVNLGTKAFTINPGDRIAQLVISPVVRAQIIEAKTLKKTKRGAGGFGHTGVGKR